MKRKRMKPIAELLGASASVNFQNARDFILVRSTGKLRSRKVRHYSEYEANQAEQGEPATLCTTSGQSFSHCLYLASKYFKDFLALVGGYRILSGEELDPKFYYAPSPSSKKRYPVEVRWYRRVPEYKVETRLIRVRS